MVSDANESFNVKFTYNNTLVKGISITIQLSPVSYPPYTFLLLTPLTNLHPFLIYALPFSVECSLTGFTLKHCQECTEVMAKSKLWRPCVNCKLQQFTMHLLISSEWYSVVDLPSFKSFFFFFPWSNSTVRGTHVYQPTIYHNDTSNQRTKNWVDK